MDDDLRRWLRNRIDEDRTKNVLPYMRPLNPFRDIAGEQLDLCEVLNLIVERYERALDKPRAEQWLVFTRGQDHGYRTAMSNTIRELALIYRDRPGYREEWRP